MYAKNILDVLSSNFLKTLIEKSLFYRKSPFGIQKSLKRKAPLIKDSSYSWHNFN